MLHSEARAYARPIALGEKKEMHSMLSMSKVEAAMLRLLEAGTLGWDLIRPVDLLSLLC